MCSYMKRKISKTAACIGRRRIISSLLLSSVVGAVGIIIIIIMNFYSPVSNTRCHSIGHKMRIARIKIRVDSPGRWERA